MHIWDGGRAVPLFDDRILAEYREVISRPPFALVLQEGIEIVRALAGVGEQVKPDAITIQVADPKDLPFLEVAVSGKADAVVTFNVRHFAPYFVGRVLTPGEFLGSPSLPPPSK